MLYSIILKYVFLPSLMASVVIILILFIKFILKKRLSAEWHYYIWLLLLLKLLIPYTPESSLSIFNYLNIPTENIMQAAVIENNTKDNNIINIKSSFTNKNQANIASIRTEIDNTKLQNKIDNKQSTPQNTLIKSDTIEQTILPIKLFSIAWLIGVILIFIYTLILNFKLLLRFKSPLYKNERLNKIFKECKNIMQVKSSIRIYTADKITNVPSLWGILKPNIIVPMILVNKLTDNELKFIILHELSHFKRKDNLVNILIIFFKVINWFNPLFWYACYIINEDCEVACDAMALRSVQSEEIIEYGNTLIYIYELTSLPRPLIGMSTLFKNKFQLKRRINMIALFKKKSIFWSIIGIVIILAIAAFTLTNGKKPVKQSNNSTTVAQNSNNTNSTATPNVSDNTNNANKANNNPAITSTDNTSSPAPSSTASNQSKKETEKNPSKTESSEVYKNERFGFTIDFPESWKGKYTIKESDDGIRVYFKPNEKPVDGVGFLFGVIKKSDKLDESVFDTVSTKIRYFKANGITYVIGGPTDLNFPENHPEFKDFLKMNKESAGVVETLKNIN